MIRLGHDTLSFSFPDVHRDAVLQIGMERTRRVPADDRDHLLPQDPGRFPVRAAVHVQQESAALSLNELLLPLPRAEAVWLSFTSPWGFPFAVKVSFGAIDALTGHAAVAGLHRSPQDYVPVPEQTWLDGWPAASGTMHQFTFDSISDPAHGAAAGGIHLVVYPLKSEVYEAGGAGRSLDARDSASPVCYSGLFDGGFTPGARLHTELLEDPHGSADWDLQHMEECFVRFVDPAEWHALTGADRP